MSPSRTAEEQWELLQVTLDLATGFELVLVACATEDVRERLRARLKHACETQGRRFLAPERGEDGLDWLARLQASPQDTEEPLPVLFYPFPADPEREIWALHRLNENRDNLRSPERGVRGMLLLAGGPLLLKHAAREAPDLWSVRARSFELADLELPEDVPRAAAAPVPAEKETAEQWSHAVFLSGAFRDRQAVEVLKDALKLDGIEDTVVDKESLFDHGLEFARAAAESKVLVFVLSPDFIHAVWPRAEPLFAGDPKGMSSRAIALMLRRCVPPAPLRSVTTLDWTSEENRLENYATLVALLRKKLAAPASPDPPARTRDDPPEKRAGKPRVSQQAAAMVAKITQVYVPPTPWWKKVALLMTAVLAFTLVSWAHDTLTAARDLFPDFGLGTLTAEADTGRAEHPWRRPCVTGTCLNGVKGGVRLDARGWTSGFLRLILKKPLGIGSVNLEDRFDGKVSLTVHVASTFQDPPPVLFYVVLANGEKEARYRCYDREPGRSRMFRLEDEPKDFDLSDVDRIELLFPHPAEVPEELGVNRWRMLEVEGMAITGVSDKKPCPLVKGR